MSHQDSIVQRVCKYTHFRVYTLMIVLLFLFLSQGIFSQNTWNKYLLGDKNTYISFPNPPTEKRKDLHTQLGVLPSYSLTFSPAASDPNFLYSGQWVAYPQNTFPADSTELISLALHETIAALSENLKCKIVYESEADNTKNMKIFRLEDAVSRQAVKGKIVLFEDRMITLTVYTTIEKSLNDNIDLFLHSLVRE